MRVLLINSVCGIRSTGRICTDIAEEYIGNGHEVRIAYGREMVPLEYQPLAVPICNKLDTYVNVLKARLLDNEGFNCKRKTRAFLKWAEEYNPDLLWIHNLHGYYINVEMLFDWVKSRPKMQVRWTLHDCWAFTGHCPHFSVAGCNKWREQCKDCTQVKAYPRSFGRDNSCDNFSKKKAAFTGVRSLTLITPSHWLGNLVKESFLKEYPVEVVHNTIDQDIFRPTESNFREKYGMQKQKIILGVASAWSDRKGLSDFVALRGKLDESYAIVLVGVTAAQQKKMPADILCISHTNSKQELAEIYSAADVFLNLTYEDNYPTVNLESQACGTPCITYRTGGSGESVPEDCVVEQGDLSAIVEKIQSVLSSGGVKPNSY